MDELYYQAVDLLEKLIATPSASRREKEAADLVEGFLKENGLLSQRHGNNVWALAPGYDPEKPTLMLNSHLDTVKPVEAWTRDPYTPCTDSEERLFGLGSNDAGASLVSLLAAFLYLKGTRQKYNLLFLASAEEEVSGPAGIESVIPLLPKVKIALVGEPTDMRPAIAEKGLMVLDGEITGVSGHAARQGGVNAIYRALPVIEALRQLKLPKVSPLLGEVKITVTQIQAGTQHNVIPDKCRIVVDVRTTECYSNAETLELIRRAVPECALTAHSTRLNSSRIDPSHPIVRRMEMLGAEPTGSPTLSDQALMPWQSLKLGPGSPARSHIADEFVYLHEIRDAIETYVKLLDGTEI